MPEPVLFRGSLRIAGSGIAVPTCPGPDGPKPVVSNDDLCAILGARAESERKRQAIARMLRDSGAQARHWSHWIGSEPHPDEQSAADLAIVAARQALASAGIAAGEVDLLILALSTSTLPTIATCTEVCDRLGHSGPSFDLKAGCAGSLYALQVAAACLAGGYRHVLVIGADCMSKYLDPPALAGFTTVGDAAGAVVLTRGEPDNFLSALDGDYATWRTAGVFGTLPPRPEDPEAYLFRGTPTRLRDLVATRYEQSLRHVLTASGLEWRDLEAWIPHQISPGLIDQVAAAFGPHDLRIERNFARYGNTGSASLLVGLHEARAEVAGGWTALCALGGGMRWGAALWRGVNG